MNEIRGRPTAARCQDAAGFPPLGRSQLGHFQLGHSQLASAPAEAGQGSASIGPPSIVRLVIVDDHRLFREATIAALRLDPSMHILGQGASAAQALALARDLRPDIMLLDITMPGNGLRAARAIHQTFPQIRIVMLTFSAEDDDVHTALAAGVRGYVVKGVGGRQLRGIVRSVAAGHLYLAPEVRSLAPETEDVAAATILPG